MTPRHLFLLGYIAGIAAPVIVRAVAREVEYRRSARQVLATAEHIARSMGGRA